VASLNHHFKPHLDSITVTQKNDTIIAVIHFLTIGPAETVTMVKVSYFT
jgi:hypothetical protein